jgi:hypothetical protein
VDPRAWAGSQSRICYSDRVTINPKGLDTSEETISLREWRFTGARPESRLYRGRRATTNWVLTLSKRSGWDPQPVGTQCTLASYGTRRSSPQMARNARTTEGDFTVTVGSELVHSRQVDGAEFTSASWRVGVTPEAAVTLSTAPSLSMSSTNRCEGVATRGDGAAGVWPQVRCLVIRYGPGTILSSGDRRPGASGQERPGGASWRCFT